MRTRGKSAWLITWEGPDADKLARCKVVTTLPPQIGEESMKLILRALFCSEYPLTLGEKLFFGTARGKDMPRFFHQPYRDVNPELCYGLWPKQYLSARKVKHLRCEDSKTNDFAGTLFWTEPARYIPVPLDPSAPLPDDLSKLTKMVRDERQESYTYSSRPLLRPPDTTTCHP